MLGGPVLKQHVVEFIRGVGLVTDGVVDDTSLNGPWAWRVPDGVAQIEFEGCGGGAGGAGGQTSGAARGGGGGGGSGVCVRGVDLPVIPNSTLTITVAAGGGGGAAGGGGGSGGTTTVDGLVRSPYATFCRNFSSTKFELPGGYQGSVNGTAGNGGQGGGCGSGAGGNSLGIVGGGNGGTANASPGGGSIGTELNITSAVALFGVIYGHGGSGGGAASTTPTTAGAGGAGWRGSGGRALNCAWSYGSFTSGNTDGSVSYGGGGTGGPSIYGVPGDAGNGQASASVGQGFGYGGSGGGGNGAGSAGGDGYARFTYWSAD